MHASLYTFYSNQKTRSERSSILWPYGMLFMAHCKSWNDEIFWSVARVPLSKKYLRYVALSRFKRSSRDLILQNIYLQQWRIVQQWYWLYHTKHWFIVLGFNDTSTLVGRFMSSPREREKRDRRDSTGDEKRDREDREQEWKCKNRRNKYIPTPPLPLSATRIAGLAQL